MFRKVGTQPRDARPWTHSFLLFLPSSSRSRLAALLALKTDAFVATLPLLLSLDPIPFYSKDPEAHSFSSIFISLSLSSSRHVSVA